MTEFLSPSRQVSEEEMLLDHVERLDRHRAGRIAAILHLSLLRPHNQRPHHMRIFRKMIEPLVERFDASIFQLYDNDIVIIARNAEISDIDHYVLHGKYLFSDDPLFSGNNPQEDFFCEWFNVEKDYQLFTDRVKEMCRKRLAVSGQVRSVAQHVKAGDDAQGMVLTPMHMEQLEKAIANADLANMLRRQEACALSPGKPPISVFHEIFFSMAYLAQQVMPGYNVTANKWLFQHLTRTLDQRMLALLVKREYVPILKNASFNLNLSTVLSQEFLNFDAKTNVVDRGSIAIEINHLDIISEPGDFLFCRDFLKKRGYKLVLDGVKHLLLPLMDRRLLGFDYVKIICSPDFADDVLNKRGKELTDAVKRIGADHVVLCRVDTESAVAAAEKLGIRIFQGRIIDALMQSKYGAA